jgi:hypothetical protein
LAREAGFAFVAEPVRAFAAGLGCATGFERALGRALAAALRFSSSLARDFAFEFWGFAIRGAPVGKFGSWRRKSLRF